MAEGLVLDSSAALAVVLGEADGPRVRERLAEVAGQPLLVLDLFWLEVVNVLVRRWHWDADAVVEAVRDLDELGIETVALDRPLTLSAIDLAAASGMTADDAAHLALAEAADVRLLTLDADLAAAAGERSVLPSWGGIAEVPAAYRSAGDRPDWTRHGTYLAELRRAAAG